MRPGTEAGKDLPNFRAGVGYNPDAQQGQQASRLSRSQDVVRELMKMEESASVESMSRCAQVCVGPGLATGVFLGSEQHQQT